MNSEFDDPFYQKYVDNTYRDHCEVADKTSYRTKTQARKRRRELELKHGAYFRIYECPHCHLFHLSTTFSKFMKND